MERTGRSFNEFLKTYKEDISEAELAVYNVKSAQFALANELIELRRAEGLTQAALAEVTGISQPEISRIETGEANPNVGRLIRIAEALHVRIGFIDDRN